MQHDKYSRPSHSARSVAESRNPFTDEKIKRYGSCNYVQDDKEKKAWMLRLSRSMTLVAIITFHSSSHSVVSRSEIAESRKGMDAATYAQSDKYSRPSHSARSVAESRNPFTDEKIKRYGSCNYVQDDKEKKAWMLRLSRSMTLVAIITFHSSSHSVVSRSEIAESRKGVAAATFAQHDIGGYLCILCGDDYQFKGLSSSRNHHNVTDLVSLSGAH